MPYPGWNEKQIRQYRHIKASEGKKRGAKDAKRIAAATVNKQKAKKMKKGVGGRMPGPDAPSSTAPALAPAPPPPVANTNTPPVKQILPGDLAKDKCSDDDMSKALFIDLEKAHVGFAAMKEKLAHKPGIKNPGAVAAAIGRKKYGKKKMSSAAKRGKPLKDSQKLHKSEGSRGGKVIGHTRSGKPIYGQKHTAIPNRDKSPANFNSAVQQHVDSHEGYTHEDHYDAYNAHEKLARDKTLPVAQRNLHVITAKKHEKAAEKDLKSKAAEKLKNPSPAMQAVLDKMRGKTTEKSMDVYIDLEKAEGARGGKVIGHTKSGKPKYQSKYAKQAPAFDKMMQHWHHRAEQSKKPEDHAVAAKQALASAFYHHHNDDKVAAHQSMDYAHHHMEKYKKHGHESRTTKWVDKNHESTAKLVGYESDSVSKSLRFTPNRLNKALALAKAEDGACDPLTSMSGGYWLKPFKGTALWKQALALMEKDVELEAERVKADAERAERNMKEAKERAAQAAKQEPYDYDKYWRKQRAIEVERKQLQLKLVKLSKGQSTEENMDPKDNLQKSTTEDGLEDLFKSEINGGNTKSARIQKALSEMPEDELEKALAARRAKSGKSTTEVKDENTQPEQGGGKTAGANGATPTRSNGGVPQTTDQGGTPTGGPGGGGAGKVKKSDDGETTVAKGADDSSSESVSKGKKKDDAMSSESMSKGMPLVQWQDTGTDEYVADEIAKGMVGDGAITSMPLDVQHRLGKLNGGGR